MQEINVKMGEIEITTTSESVLVAPSLGSCIGLGIYDRKLKYGGMAHIVLPDSSASRNGEAEEKPGKYADLGVEALLNKIITLGSKKEDLIVKLVGGAQMFALKDNTNVLNIGQRNAAAVNEALSGLGLKAIKSDVGGNKGRTFKLNPMTGKFYLRLIGQQEVEF